MPTPDTPPHRATPEQWRHAAIGVDSPAIAETRGAIKALREALAALERRVGALEELTTTPLADVADAFEQAAQQVTPAAAPASVPPTAGKPQIGRTLLDDLCAEHGFQYDDEESLDILLGIVNHVLAMSAPAAAPSPSAGSLLVEVVARAIEQCDAPENASKAAIAAVAGWLDSNAGLPELATPKESDGWQMAAQILSQEARK